MSVPDGRIASVVTASRVDNEEMSPRSTEGQPPHRKEFWERWPVRIAVLCATLALVGVGIDSESYAAPEHSSWHAKTTLLLREIGFASPLEKRARP
ncbi:hypothetical protein BH09ACT7_BH09ACT7_45030 [soil metagenome]